MLFSAMIAYVALAPVSGSGQVQPMTYPMVTGEHLARDTVRLAIQQAPGRSRAEVVGGVGDLLAASGHAVASVRQHAISGWSILTLRDPMDDAAMGVQLDRLAQQGVFASPVFVGLDGGEVFATRTLLVGAGEFGQQLEEQAEASGIVLERDWANMPGAYLIQSDARHGLEILARARALSEIEGVEWAEPDMVFTGSSSLTPNDPLFPSQWAMLNNGSPGKPGFDLGATEAWDVALGSAEVPVLIIDTGVDPSHPDLNLIPGVDTTSESGDGGPVNSNDRHGTPVAGCVSAIMNNGIGITGIAPESPSMSARAFISVNSSGNWTSAASWSVNALTAGENAGVRVTNNSNFYGFTSAAFEAKLAMTRDAGMVHFASAGNNNAFGSTYPASLETVLSVAATDRFGERSSFSNFGPDVFISAPGTSVLSTDIRAGGGYSGSDYATVSGTSFASPYAAGVAALVLSVDPTLSASEVEAILAESATPYGTDGVLGAGFIDAAAAVEQVASMRCLADVNRDGELNGLDFGAWLGAYNAQLPSADQNQDGSINGLDFGAWLGGFNAGCN